MIELSTSAYDPASYTFSYNKPNTILALAQSLGFQYDDKICNLQTQIQFLNLHPDQYVPYEDWQVKVKINSEANDCNIDVESIVRSQSAGKWMPGAYIAMIVGFAVMNTICLYKFHTESLGPFKMCMSATSLSLIVCLDFQFFGYNLVLGLLTNVELFGYMSLASVSVFFCILVKIRIAYSVLQVQNQHHPRIEDRNWGNPVVGWGTKLSIFVVVCYGVSFFIMGTVNFDYWIMGFYIFPIPQILHSAKYGSRNCFKWQYQVVLWGQSICIPIFLKG
jgi:hypothetical protein